MALDATAKHDPRVQLVPTSLYRCSSCWSAFACRQHRVLPNFAQRLRTSRDDRLLSAAHRKCALNSQLVGRVVARRARSHDAVSVTARRYMDYATDRANGVTVLALDGVCCTCETIPQYSVHARERLQVNSCRVIWHADGTYAPDLLKSSRTYHGGRLLSSARRQCARRSQVMAKRAQ